MFTVRALPEAGFRLQLRLVCRLAQALLVLACAFPLATVRAAVCPTAPFPQVAPADRESVARELARLQPLLDQCLDRADFYAYRGVLFLSLGRVAQAVESLERALLLNPDMPGVQLDYAQALAQGGERRSAGALLSGLLERPDLHPDFRGFLETQRSALLRPRWLYGLRVTSQLGHESNLNSAPSTRFFTLTPTSGDITLELDPASRPRKGAAWLNSLSATGFTDLGAGQAIFVLGDIRTRQSRDQTDYLQAEGSVVWRSPTSFALLERGSHLTIRAGASQFDFGGKTLFQGLRTEIGAEFPTGDCRIRGGLAREGRSFPDSPANDGSYLGLVVSAHCMQGEHMISLHLNTGQDRPDRASRPGGEQRRSEVGLGWSRDFDKVGFHLIGAYSWARDDQPYSPLIANGAIRRLDRYLLRGEMRVAIDRRWQWVVTVEDSRQSGNITLFGIGSQAFYAGLRAHFE
jgi:tetratricopeptide (TPR) repeat protein